MSKELKTVWLGFRCTPKVKNLIMEKVNKSGLLISDYLQKSALEIPIKEKPSEEFYNAIKEIRYLSNNINQIATKAHALGYIDAVRYDNNFKEINEFMIKIKEKFL